MKMIKNSITNGLTGWLASLLFLFTACSDKITEEDNYPEEGALLNLTVGIEQRTRAIELPTVNDMNESFIEGKEYDLKHVGLYIYYQSDYNNDDLSLPYVRNLECKIEGGKLVQVNATGKDKDIYIYDNMAIVAFYPYNKEMSETRNHFTKKADEDNYPITREDYSEQYYIPYRAVVQNVNPTNSYLAELVFRPKHTAKVEIILVSNSPNAFPTGDIRLVPMIDPVNANLAEDCIRENWYDAFKSYTPITGGSYIHRYTAYIWQDEPDPRKNHAIRQGDILFESDQLTLFASEEVDFKEQHAYRYGYNLDTGEVFIPTSSYLIHDPKTLSEVDCYTNDAYQVCDIDLSHYGEWTPVNILQGIYDGGGHKITGMKINTAYEETGLFGRVYGDASIRNVNLIEPEINFHSDKDSCYVGALCGRVNGGLTEELRRLLRNQLPPELSDVVKEALLQEMLSGLQNSTSQVIACRVENPRITLTSTGKVRVGSLAGANGTKTEEGTFYGKIWDSYVSGGTILVNESNMGANHNVLAAGFCGLNNGTIERSYSTTENIVCNIEFTPGIGDPIVSEKYEGFCWIPDSTEPEYTGKSEVKECFMKAEGHHALKFTGGWPLSSWIKYNGKWPILTRYWDNSTNYSYWYTVGGSTIYPSLHWERR